jgi:hypothetical protein
VLFKREYSIQTGSTSLEILIASMAVFFFFISAFINKKAGLQNEKVNSEIDLKKIKSFK